MIRLPSRKRTSVRYCTAAQFHEGTFFCGGARVPLNLKIASQKIAAVNGSRSFVDYLVLKLKLECSIYRTAFVK